jgi:prepilin signal peptidase PulO-like enzyme (type II secretory pathway)
MQLFVILTVFLFGLVIGSFLNVVIYRTLHDESPFKGRSKCPKCKKQIAWYDNIPLLSYFLLGGKCRKCKKAISVQYPIVEGMTGILFVWWYVVGFAFFSLTSHPLTVIQPAYWLVIGILLLIILVTDFMTYLIPDFTVALIALLSLIYRVYLVNSGVMVATDMWNAVYSGAGLGFFFFLLVKVTRGRGMGMGDVYFAFALGLLLGWPRSLIAVFLAFLIGALAGIVLIILKKKNFGQTIPFGPFLVLGTLAALMWGYDVWMWYLGLLV